MSADTEDEDVPPDTNVFRLDEYHRAGRAFLSDAVKAVVSANSPLLASIHVEHVEAMPVTRNTFDDGQVLDHEPTKVASTVTMSISDVIEGRFDDVHAAVVVMAQEYTRQVTASMFAQLSDICDATGNVVDGVGRPIWEAYLEALEVVALSFDSDGTVTLPQLANVDLANLPPQPDDFEERIDAVVQRRRDEWMATRRTRRLSRDRQ